MKRNKQSVGVFKKQKTVNDASITDNIELNYHWLKLNEVSIFVSNLKTESEKFQIINVQKFQNNQLCYFYTE